MCCRWLLSITHTHSYTHIVRLLDTKLNLSSPFDADWLSFVSVLWQAFDDDAGEPDSIITHYIRTTMAYTSALCMATKTTTMAAAYTKSENENLKRKTKRKIKRNSTIESRRRKKVRETLYNLSGVVCALWVSSPYQNIDFPFNVVSGFTIRFLPTHSLTCRHTLTQRMERNGKSTCALYLPVVIISVRFILAVFSPCTNETKSFILLNYDSSVLRALPAVFRYIFAMIRFFDSTKSSSMFA